VQGRPRWPGGEHDDAARVADGEGGSHVLAEVQLLERHRVRLVAGDQLVDLLVDVGQASLVRGAGMRLDHAAVERGETTPAVPLHDAVAGVGQAGVDAEDDHAG